MIYVMILCSFTLPFTYGQAVRPIEAQLVDDLLNGYNKNVKPTPAAYDQIEIQVGFLLAKVKHLDERNQVMTSFGWVQMIWQDSNLVWDPAAYGGATMVVIPAEKLWLPEISLYNGVEVGEDLGISSKFRVAVFPNGIVNWIPGFKWITSCRVDLFYFPFDTQECGVKFINWMYREDLLNYTVPEAKVSLDAYDENGEWTLIDTSSTWTRLESPTYPGYHFPIAQFSVKLRRNSAYYTLNVLVPCVTLTAVQALVFMLPVESGEKVSLGVTVMLSYSVFLLMVSDVSPRAGESIPLITLYLTISMTLTALSVILTVIVLAVHHHSPDKSVPVWLRGVASCMARMLCIQTVSTGISPTIHPVPKDGMILENMEDMQEKKPLRDVATDSALPMDVIRFIRHLMNKQKDKETEDHIRQEWINVAKVMDRFFLVISCVGSLILSVVLIAYLKSGS